MIPGQKLTVEVTVVSVNPEARTLWFEFKGSEGLQHKAFKGELEEASVSLNSSTQT